MTPENPSDDQPWIERTGVLRTDWGDAIDSGPGLVELHTALATLLDLRSPTSATLVRIAPVPQGVALTHLVPAQSESLESVRRRGPLRAGHVIALGIAVLDALIDLHSAGLVHGDIGTEHVLVAPDGSVVLGGAGLAWRAPSRDRDASRPSDDIAAVGELLRDCLGAGSAPSSLVLASLRACDVDPRLRPDAVELRDLIARCGRPESLIDALWNSAPEPLRRPTTAVAGRTAAEQLARGELRIDPRVPRSVAALRPTRSRSARSARTAPPVLSPPPQPPTPSKQLTPPTPLLPRTPPQPSTTQTMPPSASPSRWRRAARSPAAKSAAAQPSDFAAGSGRSRRAARPARAKRDTQAPRRPRRGGARLLFGTLGLGCLAGLLVAGLRVMPGALAADTGAPGHLESRSPSTSPSTAAVRMSATPAVDPYSEVASEPGASGGVTGPVVSDVLLDPVESPPQASWADVLATIDDGRRAALSSGSVTRLRDWVDPQGAAWHDDAALAARVSSLGAHIEGGALVALDLRLQTEKQSVVVLLVRDRREAYTVVTGSGRTTVVARGPKWWRVTLARAVPSSEGSSVAPASPWRIRAVTAAADTAQGGRPGVG